MMPRTAIHPLKMVAGVGASFVLWVVLLAYTASPAHAAAPTICVIGGACHPSLQAAINAANAGDTIEIGAGEDTEAGIVISKNLTIRGQSATQSIVQAAASPSTATNRVFVINSGVTATLQELTVRYGYIDGNGGGISNGGTLTLRRVTVSQNDTRDGISRDCSRSSCRAGDGFDGGGIYNTGTLSVEQSTISDNSTGKGGDVFGCGGSSCVAGRGGDGGGIYNSVDRTLEMTNSTLSGNRTGLGGECTPPWSCFRSSNAGLGGGLQADVQFAHLDNVTITNNRGRDAGGINHTGGASGSIVTLKNSIVAGNLTHPEDGQGHPADCSSVGGVGIVSEGHNLVGAGTGCPSGSTGDLTTSDPKLGALADNGGPTKTHALLSGSPAIDAGPPTSRGTSCPPPLTDQRRVDRPQDGNGDSTSRCDIGAFELDTTRPSVTIEQASGQADPTSTSLTVFTAVFNEPVTGFTDSDVTLSGTAGATTAVVIGGPTTYIIVVSGMTSDGTVIASLPADAARDTALNGNTASTSTDNTVTFDAPNRPPTAQADSYTTNEDTPLTANGVGSNPAGVLANDTDDDGDSLDAVLVSGPSHAAPNGFTLNQDGSFSYTPAANYNGLDSFTYKASDGTDDSNVATVSITVNEVNDAPTVTKVTGRSCGTNARSGTINLTVNDPDGPEESLTLSATSSNATLVPTSNLALGGAEANRTLRASALSGRTGTALITVTVSDGQATSSVEATVKVDGNGSKTTDGTTGPNLLFGQDGADVLNGSESNDLLCGGPGGDRLRGGAGDDTMTGGPGADRFIGGDGITDRATDFTPSQGDTKDNTVETF